jgi:peptide-methionine (R)-S-oxide reductase
MLGATILAACASPPAATSKSPTAKSATDAKEGADAMTLPPDALKPLNLPPDHWKSVVSPEAYRVLFERGTEIAFTSPLNDEHRAGTFVCAACNLPIFTSEMKFDSGTGWPSFTTSIPGRLAFSSDSELVYERTEYHCVRCGGHMGHVFDDGPRPTGQRWCNNGVSLKFIPKGEALPELRS